MEDEDGGGGGMSGGKRFGGTAAAVRVELDVVEEVSSENSKAHD